MRGRSPPATLQWTAAGSGPRFCLYVHHTDAEREWAYDRKSHIGQLDKGLDEAAAKGRTVVSMKDDWKTIFPLRRTLERSICARLSRRNSEKDRFLRAALPRVNAAAGIGFY